MSMMPCLGGSTFHGSYVITLSRANGRPMAASATGARPGVVVVEWRQSWWAPQRLSGQLRPPRQLNWELVQRQWPSAMTCLGISSRACVRDQRRLQMHGARPNVTAAPAGLPPHRWPVMRAASSEVSRLTRDKHAKVRWCKSIVFLELPSRPAFLHRDEPARRAPRRSL